MNISTDNTLNEERAHVATGKAFAMGRHFSDLGDYLGEVAFDVLSCDPDKADELFTIFQPFEGYDCETLWGLVHDCFTAARDTFKRPPLSGEPYAARRISPAEFMLFFRSNEQLYPLGDDDTLNRLSVNDRTEIFRGILAGADDLTAQLLRDVLIDYDRFDLISALSNDDPMGVSSFINAALSK